MSRFDDTIGGGDDVGPQPIPIRPEVEEAGEYPLDALSPKLEAAARAIVDKVQLPAAIAAMSVLACAALAVQPFVNIEMPTGQVVPTSLFFVSVGQSGERKSTADRLAMSGVKQREREMGYDWAKEQSAYQADHAAYVAARKKATTGTNKSRSQIKEMLEACGTEPLAPPQPILVSDEGTIQGLQKLFAEAMPSLGLFSDEGAQWLGGYSMQEENRALTGASLSKLWDGAPIKRVRGTEGTTILHGRRLSVHLMIQPRVAAKLFGDKELRDQGLLSRFLICQPTTNMGSRMWRDPLADSNLDLEKYEARVLGLLRAPMPMDPETRELKPRTIKLSPDARTMFIQWHDAIETELRPGGAYERVTGFAGKLPEHSMRIAAVMAYFEDRNVAEISAQALGRAIKIAQFHAAEALRLFGIASSDAETERAGELIEWIRKHQLTVVGGRFLSRNGPSRSWTAPQLKQALGMLLEMRHLVQIPSGATMAWKGKETFYREAYTVVADIAE